MLKIIKNLFQKPLPEVASSQLADFQWSEISWMAFSLNSQSYLGEIKNLHLSLTQNEQTLFHRISVKNVHFGKIPGLEYKGKTDAAAVGLTRELLDGALLWMTNSPQGLLRQKPPQGISEAEELKAYEWIRVSMIVVNQALDDLTSQAQKPQNSGEQLLGQAQIFAGTKFGQFEWRILVFQLDIQLIFQEDGGLLCTIYNDRPDQRHTSPALKALFYAQRGPVFDQIIHVINRISVLSKTYIDYGPLSP